MTYSIRVAGIVRESIVDGPGVRFTIFCQGCPHACKGCHNEQTHDFSKGYDVSIEKLLEEIEKDKLLSGVTFSGGEPFCQAESFYELAKKIHSNLKELNILTYTGYTYEELVEMGRNNEYIEKLLSETDFLIDGRYVESEKDLTLPFRGSKNQRYIDIKRSEEIGELVFL